MGEIELPKDRMQLEVSQGVLAYRVGGWVGGWVDEPSTFYVVTFMSPPTHPPTHPPPTHPWHTAARSNRLVLLSIPPSHPPTHPLTVECLEAVLALDVEVLRRVVVDVL